MIAALVTEVSKGSIASVQGDLGKVRSTASTGQLRTSRACAHRYRIALTRSAAWRCLVRDHGLDIDVGEAGPGAKRIPNQRRRADGSQTPSAQSPAHPLARHPMTIAPSRRSTRALRERCQRFRPEMNDVNREDAVKAVISEGQRIGRRQMKACFARGRQAGIEVGCFRDRFSKRPRPGDVRFAPTRPNFCSFPGSQRSAYFVSFQSIPPPAASSLLKCRRSVGPC